MRLLLALLLFATPVLAAKKPKIRFVGDPQKAVEMARTRGKLIFLTVVVDNGTSANDPADQISFSFIEWPFGNDCSDAIGGLTGGAFDGVLFDLTHGQVRVR